MLSDRTRAALAARVRGVQRAQVTYLIVGSPNLPVLGFTDPPILEPNADGVQGSLFRFGRLLSDSSVRHKPRGRSCAAKRAECEHEHGDDGSRRSAKSAFGSPHGALAITIRTTPNGYSAPIGVRM
jgi:hypothetical protein